MIPALLYGTEIPIALRQAWNPRVKKVSWRIGAHRTDTIREMFVDVWELHTATVTTPKHI